MDDRDKIAMALMGMGGAPGSYIDPRLQAAGIGYGGMPAGYVDPAMVAQLYGGGGFGGGMPQQAPPPPPPQAMAPPPPPPPPMPAAAPPPVPAAPSFGGFGGGVAGYSPNSVLDNYFKNYFASTANMPQYGNWLDQANAAGLVTASSGE